MSHTTRLYVKGAASASTARQLIAAQAPAQHALDQTIEFIGEDRNVFAKVGQFGITCYVRSSFVGCFYNRFLPVLINNTGCHCTCGDANCKHARKALRYLKENEVC